MGRINSKSKGNGFERKVAKILSDWSGVDFHRTPMSGALHNWNDTRVVSDVVPPVDVHFPFSIECKKHEIDWDFDLIMKGTSEFWKFWQQCSDDAKSENLHPMLVFNKNNREIYAAFYTSQLYVFSKYALTSVPYLTLRNMKQSDDPVSIVKLDDVLSLTDINYACKIQHWD